MPEDKDFKKLVRARMEQTGERYTQARAHLRPEAAARAPDADRELLARIVPTDVEALVELRSQQNLWREPRPLAVPPWELMILAGGPLDEMGLESLSLAGVAELGSSLQGVGFLAIGLDLLIDLPSDVSGDPLARSWSGRQSARRVHRELLELVQDRTPLRVPPESDGTRIGNDRFAVKADEAGIERLEALTETGVLLRPGADGLINVGSILDATSAFGGRAWIGYGAIVIIEQHFSERRTFTGDSAHYTLEVDPAFWTAAGDALTGAAEGVHLPAWPLEEARLQCLNSPARSWTQYRAQWGHFR
jgi:hypothetical protein